MNDTCFRCLYCQIKIWPRRLVDGRQAHGYCKIDHILINIEDKCRFSPSRRVEGKVDKGENK